MREEGSRAGDHFGVRADESFPTLRALDDELGGFEYGDVLSAATYCGGGAGFSYWLEREDLLAALPRFGLTDVTVAFEDVDHPNGPCLALAARRP